MRRQFLLVSWGVIDKTVSFAAGELPKSIGCVSHSAFSVGGWGPRDGAEWEG